MIIVIWSALLPSPKITRETRAAGCGGVDPGKAEIFEGRVRSSPPSRRGRACPLGTPRESP